MSAAQQLPFGDPRPPEPPPAAARARRTDPTTSHEAAASVTEMGPLKARVLRVLRAYGPMTDEALVARVGVELPKAGPSGIRTRRAELAAAGLVIRDGTDGRTASGRRAHRWRPAP